MKLKYVFLISFLCLIVNSFSQSHEFLDSLQNELANATEDTTKVDLRYKIGSASRLFRVSYWDSIVIDAHKLSMSKVEAECLNNIGFIYSMQGYSDSCLVYFNKSLKISENAGDNETKANSLNSIGHVLKAQGNIPEALLYFHKSLKILEELELKQGEATLLNNIATIYYDQGNFEKAVKLYTRSLVIREEIGDKYGIATCLNNLGSYYSDQAALIPLSEKTRKDSLNYLSLDYYFRALKIRKEIEDGGMIPNSLNNVAAAYFELFLSEDNKAKKDSLKGLALGFFKKGLLKSRIVESRKWETFSLNGLVQILLVDGEISNAKKYALTSFEISNELGFPKRIKQAALLLGKIYKKQGNFEKALEMYVIEVKMRDSVLNLETEKAAIQQQAKYEYEKKSAADSIANHEAKKNLQAKLEIEEANTIAEKQAKYYLYGGIGLLGFFGIFIFNRFKITQKQNRLIHKQKDEIHEQKNMIEERSQEVMDSISYAKRLQQAILPSQKDMQKELKNGFVLFQPKDVVSGDFYWMEKSESKNKTLVAVADCTGHGVPGAMVSVVCSNALDRAVKEFNLKDTGSILDKVTDLVISRFEKSGEEVNDGMDIALCLLDFNNRTLQYSGANNPLWLVREIKANEDISYKDIHNNSHILKEYKASKQPVGKYVNRTAFKTIDIEIEKGDIIYIFTDGFADQFGGKKGKKYKYKPFKKLLLEINSKEMNSQKETLTKEFKDWKGELEQIDDVCIIGIRI